MAMNSVNVPLLSRGGLQVYRQRVLLASFAVVDDLGQVAPANTHDVAHALLCNRVAV